MSPFNTGATLEIYCHGTGDFLAKVFEGVSALMGGDDYLTLIRLAGIIGTLVFTMQMLFMKEHSVKWLAGYVGLYLLFFCPQVNIAIVDYLNPANNRVVGNVPAGLGYFAHFTSSIGDKLTEMAETSFSLPDDVTYRGNGMVGGIGFLKRTTEFSLPPANLKDDIDKFIQNCTFYDVFDGTISNEQLLKSTDLATLIFTSQQTRFTTYHSPADSTTTVVDTCVNVGPILQARLAAEYPNLSAQLRQLIFANLPVDFEGKLVNTYDYFMNVARSAQDIVIHNMLANQVVESTKNFAIATGGDAKLLSLALAQAVQEQKAQWYVVGDLAQKTIPVFRAILEGVFYGAFPFIFILMLTPLMGKVLQGYILVLLSLHLWFPLEAIVNLFTSIKMREMLIATGNTGAYGPLAIDTLSGFPYMYQLTQEMLSAAWCFEIVIPVLAYSLVRGGEYALTHAIGTFTSMTQRAGMAGAHTAASGNVSLGNVGMGGVNWANVSAHGHDISYRTNLGASMNVSSGGTWGPHGFSFRRATVDGFSQSIGYVASMGLREAATESKEAGSAHLTQASKSADATLQRTRSFTSALEHSHGHTKSTQAAEETAYVKDAQEAKQALVQKGIDLGFSREAMTQYVNTLGLQGGIGNKGTAGFFSGSLGIDASRRHQETGKVAESAQELERWIHDNKIGERISRGQKVVDSYAADTRDSEMSRTAKEIRAGQTETIGHQDQASKHFREAEGYTKAAERAERMDYGTAAQIEHMYLKGADAQTKAAYAKGDDLELVAGGAAWAKKHAPELQKMLGDASGFETPAIEKPADHTGASVIPTVNEAAGTNAAHIPSTPDKYGSTRDDVHTGERYIRASLQDTETRMRQAEETVDAAKGRVESITPEIREEAVEPGFKGITRSLGTNRSTAEEAEERRKR